MPESRSGCDSPLSDERLRLMVESATMIVIGRVTSIAEGAAPGATETAHVQPEAFLKGPSTGAELRFERQGPVMPCQYAEFEVDDRIIVISQERTEPFDWPSPSASFRLTDGRAMSFNPADTRETTELALVARIRSITGQYAVPAASSDEGASLDWVGTVLPVGAGLLVIFGISLVLMRLWHRIDPS